MRFRSGSASAAQYGLKTGGTVRSDRHRRQLQNEETIMFKTISAALLATAMLAAPAFAATTTKATVAAKPAVTAAVTTPAKPAIAKPAVKEVRHARLHRSHKVSKHVARAFHHKRISVAKASIKPMPKLVIKHKA
jgi:hypothetical protein